jgi:DNA-binding Lrp family transcriptional regulator
MVKEKEKHLIINLRKNGRQKIKTIAQKHNYPTSTMTDVLHKMEEKGILKHKTNIQFEKIGYPIKILIAIKTGIPYRNQLRTYLKNNKNVNTLHMINTGYDYHCEAIFKNQKEVQEFTEKLRQENQIKEMKIFYIIETITHEKFLTEEEHFE